MDTRVNKKRNSNNSNKVQIINIFVDNLTMNDALQKIKELAQSGVNSYVLTPNVDHIVRLENDKEFKEIYENADLVLPDGKPLIWISKLFSTPLKDKISGSDLFPKVCELASKNGFSIYLLGAAEGVATKAAFNLKRKFPDLIISGTFSPKLGFETDSEELGRIFENVKAAKPDILILGLGCPKQEKFFFKYRTNLNVPLALHFGASIDFEAGVIKRAPKWMSCIGLEWLFRFFQEPNRLFKRYFIDDMKIFSLMWKYRKSAIR